jgi:hypothetical protein
MKDFQARRIVEIINNECILGYAKLDINIRDHFEQKTRLGQRLVSLIRVRLELEESINLYFLLSTPKQLFLDMTSVLVSYLMLWNAKKNLEKNLPHLFRDYAHDLKFLNTPLILNSSELSDMERTIPCRYNLMSRHSNQLPMQENILRL